MRGVKWIFFDVGSTLVDEKRSYARGAQELLAGTDIPLAEFEARREALARAGTPGDSTLAASFGLTAPPWPSGEEIVFPDAVSTLRTLRQRGYRLGIIANQEPGLPARLDARGLGEFLSVILSSAEFGSAKPEPGIFEAALRQANCRPEEAAMVGDRLDNDIAPARKLGMRTVRILQGYGALAQPRNAEETPDAQVHTLAELLALFPPVMSQED